jgi:hypothetical protein
MILPANVLKRKAKFGPKMGRETQTEYLRFLVGAGPRSLTSGAAAKIRAELERLEQSGNGTVQRFVSVMRSRYPEVLG